MKDNCEHTLLLFEDLINRHTDLVFHVARSWTGDVGQAEELTQLTFIKAWKAFHQFQTNTNFKAWVLKILRNTFIDRKRAQKKDREIFSLENLSREQEPEAEVPPPQSIDFENREIFYDLFGDEIARLLKKIPEDFQLAVLLCDVEGLTYPEIADVLHLPVGTVRSRIHRGRAMLSELLQDHAKNIGYIREKKT